MFAERLEVGSLPIRKVRLIPLGRVRGSPKSLLDGRSGGRAMEGSLGPSQEGLVDVNRGPFGHTYIY